MRFPALYCGRKALAWNGGVIDSFLQGADWCFLCFRWFIQSPGKGKNMRAARSNPGHSCIINKRSAVSTYPQAPDQEAYSILFGIRAKKQKNLDSSRKPDYCSLHYNLQSLYGTYFKEKKSRWQTQCKHLVRVEEMGQIRIFLAKSEVQGGVV